MMTQCCGTVSGVVARSPDRATYATEGPPEHTPDWWHSRRPSVRPGGTVRRPCHNKLLLDDVLLYER